MGVRKSFKLIWDLVIGLVLICLIIFVSSILLFGLFRLVDIKELVMHITGVIIGGIYLSLIGAIFYGFYTEFPWFAEKMKVVIGCLGALIVFPILAVAYIGECLSSINYKLKRLLFKKDSN